MLRVAPTPGADELRGHGEEGLFYVRGVFGARLQEGNAQRLRVLLRGRTVHHLVLAVALVAFDLFLFYHEDKKKKRDGKLVASRQLLLVSLLFREAGWPATLSLPLLLC